MKLQLHKYMEISGMGLNVGEVTIPGVFVALGGSILIFSSLACCCTAKGKAPLLYLVSQFQTISSPILYLFFCFERSVWAASGLSTLVSFLFDNLSA